MHTEVENRGLSARHLSLQWGTNMPNLMARNLKTLAEYILPATHALLPSYVTLG
jgi:hypothetical protein